MSTHTLQRSCLAALILIGSSTIAVEQADTERDAITRAALDYIEGFYTADATRMERSLHPQLAKRIRRVDAAGAVRIDNQDAAQLVALTRNRAGTPPANQQKDVTILDVFRNAATVKVVANAWIDYLHLTKTDDGWRIVNVLWEMNEAP